MSAENEKYKPKKNNKKGVQISYNLNVRFFLSLVLELLNSKEFCLIIIQMIVNPNKDYPGFVCYNGMIK